MDKVNFLVLSDSINKKIASILIILLIGSVISIGILTHKHIPKTFYELEGNNECI